MIPDRVRRGVQQSFCLVYVTKRQVSTRQTAESRRVFPVFRQRFRKILSSLNRRTLREQQFAMFNDGFDLAI